MGVSNKVLLPIGLLLLAGAGYYLATQDSHSDHNLLELTQGSEVEESAAAGDLPELSADDLAASDSDSNLREEVVEPVQPELDEGLQTIKGKAMFSKPLPTDEDLYVMNLSRRCSRQELYRGPGDDEIGLSQLVWQSGEEAWNTLMDPEIDTGLDDVYLVSYAPVGANGQFEIKVPEDAEVLHLALAGRYSYSMATEKVHVDDPIFLTGHLGAWVTGQLSGPIDLEGNSPLGEVKVALSPDLSAGFNAQDIQEVALGIEEHPDEQGKFEFRSVPIEYASAFFASSENFGAIWLRGRDGLHLAPGEHRHVEANLAYGATLRGVVMDEFMRPVTNGSIALRVPGTTGRALGKLREGVVGEDGTFEIKHVMTGMRMELSVDSTGYLIGKEKVAATLQDGDVVDEILIQLKKGNSIAGRVTFDDGTPAVEAEVYVQPDFANVDPAMIGQIAASFVSKTGTTDEDGKFELLGLGPGKYRMVAKFEEELEEGEVGLHPGKWSGSVTGLEGTEQDVAITLDALSVIRATVSTESGLEIGKLEVRMTLKGSGGIMGVGAYTKDERPDAPEEDGSFEIDGIDPGVWEVSVKAEGFSASEKLEVTVPQADGVPIPSFVLIPASSLSGLVYDETGSPTSGATVTLELDMAGIVEAGKTGGAPKAFSNYEGKFYLEDVAPGSHSISASKYNYAASEVLPIDFVAGEAVEDIKLTLRVGGSISGEVFDKEGEPVSGRSIIVQKVPAYNDQTIMESDRDGRFFVDHLDPGQYQVISMVNVMDGSLDVSDGNGTANMMENLLMEQAEVIDGENTEIILGAPPADPLALTGKVVCDGKAVDGAVVVMRAAEAEGLGAMLMATTDSHGGFSKTLADRGAYLVTVQTGISTGLQNSIESMVHIPEGVTEHNITIELPLGGIAGTVYGADGKPAAKCRVTMHVGDGIAYGSFLGGHYTEMLTDEKGNYAIDYLEAGKYDLAAGGATMGGLLGDDSDLGRQMQSGVVVTEGEWVRGVDFRLEAPAELKGTVTGIDGAPVAGAAIFVRGENGLLVDRFSFVTTNASGKFTYSGLAEGRYRVSAKKEDQVSSQSEAVRVAAGEESSTEVQLANGTMLLVSVVDKGGSELRPKVSVRDENGEEWAGVLSIEQIMAELGKGFSDKEQRVGPIPAGKYYVVATLEDGRTARKVVTVKGQAERKVRIRLK